MTLTTIDPTTALIVIDLQKGVVALPVAHPIDGVIANAAKLAGAFRDRGLPVVLVNVTGGAPGRTERARRSGASAADAAQLIPELGPEPTDHLVTKRTWGAFTGTGLDDHLKGLGVTQVVIAGVATSIGVESTARHAWENGFHVTLAIDAMTDMSPESHEHSTGLIFPRLGETGTTDEILDLLPSAGA